MTIKHKPPRGDGRATLSSGELCRDSAGSAATFTGAPIGTAQAWYGRPWKDISGGVNHHTYACWLYVQASTWQSWERWEAANCMKQEGF